MKRLAAGTAIFASLVRVVVLCAMVEGRTQNSQAAYPNIAPLDQYLTADRNTEIAMARSAAPESVSQDAEVMVLGRHG